LLSSRQEEKAGTMNFSEKGSPSVSEFKDWIPFGPVKSKNNPKLIADPPWNLWPLFLERRIQRKNRSHVNFETQFLNSIQYGVNEKYKGEITDAQIASPLKRISNSELQYTNIKPQLPMANHSYK
jgi:hypothetical protein